MLSWIGTTFVCTSGKWSDEVVASRSRSCTPFRGTITVQNTATSNHLIRLRKPRLLANILERSDRHSRHWGHRKPDRARRRLDDAADGGHIFERSGSEAARNCSMPQALRRPPRAAGNRSNGAAEDRRNDRPVGLNSGAPIGREPPRFQDRDRWHRIVTGAAT
jgi:hypothetical protein